MRQIYTLTIIFLFSFLNSTAQNADEIIEHEQKSTILLNDKSNIVVKQTSQSISNSNKFSNNYKNDVLVINISPNPSRHFIQVSGLKKTEYYRIYNILGKEVSKGLISENETINIQNLKNGLYLLKINNTGSKKFLKE